MIPFLGKGACCARAGGAGSFACTPMAAAFTPHLFVSPSGTVGFTVCFLIQPRTPIGQAIVSELVAIGRRDLEKQYTLVNDLCYHVLVAGHSDPDHDGEKRLRQHFSEVSAFGEHVACSRWSDGAIPVLTMTHITWPQED